LNNDNAKESINNLEGTKFSEIINNILDDNILISESVRKSVDTEEISKLITPKFSPLNLLNSVKRFKFFGNENEIIKVNSHKALVYLLKSW